LLDPDPVSGYLKMLFHSNHHEDFHMPRDASREKEKALRDMIFIVEFLDPQRCNRRSKKETVLEKD
jgi:hypothetical protein